MPDCRPRPIDSFSAACSFFVLMPDLSTDLMSWPYVVIRFRCDFCRRGRDARLVLCAVHYGPRATIGEILDAFRGKCWRHRTEATGRAQKYGIKCTAEVLDLGSPGRPPDLPSGMTRLRVVKGDNALRGSQNPFEAIPATKVKRQPS